MTKRNILRLMAPIFIGSLILLGIASCTTQKNNWRTRAFHNVCCHYNGYFWGKLAFDEGIDNLKQTHKEDYTDIIPVYVYPDPTDDGALYPNMSRAIKKADTMIQKHTITNKAKKEIPDAVHYIKYCYLLLAEAHLYKNDLLEASDILDYATKEYRKTDYRDEAVIWQARTYNELGSVSKAEEDVDLLRTDKKLPKKLIPEALAVVADWNMRIGQYAEVQAQLQKALRYEKDKKAKARYFFIIAQIAERAGENKKAYDCYTQCLMLHPYNDMDFEARIKRAILYLGGDKENEKIKENLVKMLRPTKYIDNRDQIYYALAEIALKESDEPLATTDLNKSIKASTTNKIQKAISFLALGNIAFDHESYKPARLYYDSAVKALPKKYRGRDTIVTRQQDLDKLVKALNIIDREDSLQKIAKLGQKGAEKYVDSLMASEQKENEKKEREKQILDINQVNIPVIGASNGKWYFYNPSAVSQGIAEFIQHWGNRPLEDNWRRSSKIADNLQATTGNDTTRNDSTRRIAYSKKDSIKNKSGRGKFMKNIPLTDAQMQASNDSLIEAYSTVGFIYEEHIKNYHKAEETYEEMLTRFPDNKYKLYAYYNLYKMYTQTGNQERADYYKNILLTKYPDTEYALLIKSPEKYRQQQEANRQEILKIYAATLASYKEQNYAEVLNQCAQVDSLYPKNPEMPKFAFMEAGAIGHAKGLEAYKNALEKVIIDYPKDTLKVVAQSILDYLNKKPKEAVKLPKTDTVIYLKDKDTTYFYILAIDNKQAGKITEVSQSLNLMNKNIYSQNHLTTEDLFLNSSQQILVTRKFRSEAEAKDYWSYVNSTPNILKALSSGSYQAFYISNKNFSILIKHGKSDEYIPFFNINLSH